MRKSRYAEFERAAISGYAKDKVESGTWEEVEAMALAKREHDDLLPKGLQTEHHHLFELSVDSEFVGTIWVYTTLDTVIPSAYIYDIEIDAEYHRMGYGKQAMLALEDWCMDRDIRRIALNVFAYNRPAVRLYEGLDYQATNFRMQKDL
jgi:ribosomal protein S18 acetylase RimI-like enzyme